MRDKLIHDYLGIDYDIVWDVVINKIPLDSKVDKRISVIVHRRDAKDAEV